MKTSTKLILIAMIISIVTIKTGKAQLPLMGTGMSNNNVPRVQSVTPGTSINVNFGVITDNGTNVGVNNTTPNFLLDVNGDVNVNVTTSGYRIGNGSTSPQVLWYNGNTTCIIVGVAAGSGNGGTSVPNNNTLVGNYAGNAINN